MTIDAIQKEIANELMALQGDAELITFYLLVMGQRNTGLSLIEKNEQNLVKGCHTKVWFKVRAEQNRIYLSVDSNTIIIKGLGYLLVRLFNGQTPEDIINTEMTLLQRSDLKRFLGSQRHDGVGAMIRHVQSLSCTFLIRKTNSNEKKSLGNY